MTEKYNIILHKKQVSILDLIFTIHLTMKHQDQDLTKTNLPHNFFAEKMVLSCLILDPSLIISISEQLSVETFYFKNHQELYKIMLCMVDRKLSIDILKLMTFLQSEGLLQKIGGTKVVLELANQVPNLTYFEDYVQIVNERFLRRSLIKIGYEIINSSYITNISFEHILKDLEIELLTLTNKTTQTKLTTSAQLLENVFCELKEKFLNPKLPGLSSGFTNLDSITQGFQKSDLIIIAGRPAMGKTALSLTITLNIIKEARLPILFFSMEMSKEQIIYRILAMESRINSRKLKTGKLYKNDWIKLTKIIKLLAKLPLFIDDSPNLSSQNIRSKLKTLILEQKNLGLVIIDYLQLMQNSTQHTKNRTEELSKITRDLKKIAREFNIPIIALSQLSRNVETRPNQKPILSDLRESGSIEQDADLVLMLSNTRTNSYSYGNKSIKLMELILAKHRNGPTGEIQLTFDGNQTKFLE